MKTIKILSFYANFNKKLNLFERKQTHILINLIINRVIILKAIKDNINNMQRKSTKYVNKRRKIILQLKKENRVSLLTKNLKIKKLNKKLNNIKIKSFFIKIIKRSINCKLNLLKETRIHLIFYILLLKLIDLNTFIQKEFHFENSKKKYKIKQILNKKS